jgi:type 1 glutamine amidotransferase
MKRFVLAGLAVLLCWLPLRAAPSAANPIRVLILDGQSGGPYHDWKLTTAVLKKELEDAGIFRVTVATSPQTGADFSGFKPDFGSYQVVVSNLDAPDWPAELEGQLERFVQGGGGLVVVHAADNAFPDWAAWNRMTGVGGWRGRSEKAGPYWYFKDGRLVSDLSPGPAGSHGARLPFLVTTRAPRHPIMRGLPAAWMHAPDELYATLRGPGEHMTVLATAHSDPANKGTGRDEPSLLVVDYGRGRVFHTALGHDVMALSGVGFITTFLRGTEWAATGVVTQKVPRDFPGAASVTYRVEIAEMDPAFGGGAPAKGFDTAADAALAAMRKRAGELKITGVAVVAYFEGDDIQSWTSKMSVVGRRKDLPTATDKGNNLLGIAYAKAAEMADTLKDSGSKGRPPMTGEFGWQGGVIVHGKTGWCVAAFSGGKSEDDVQVSQAGAAALKSAF